MATVTPPEQERLLFVVSAPSGTGKTSLCTEVVQQVPHLSFSISHTTRQPRQAEEQGKNYYFVSREEFMHLVSQNKMAEWTEIYGNYYGTSKETIRCECSKGDDLFFDIDERGARQLSEHYANVITILVLPPSLEVLKKRLIERKTEDEQSVRKRLNRAKEELKNMSWYTYVIVNDSLEEAVLHLKSIIFAERCRLGHSIIEGLLHE